MADKDTGELLCEAREEILKPLNYSHNRSTPGVWIPKESVINEQDLHVTIGKLASYYTGRCFVVVCLFLTHCYHFPPIHSIFSAAIPWWWHTIRPGNLALSQELVGRFRQALVLEFHHAFQLELERIVLLGGKTLVALWRTVGSRGAPDDFIIFDRHGEGQGTCYAGWDLTRRVVSRCI